MGFLKQEYWSRLLFPPPGDLPDPGIEPKFPALADGFLATEPPGKPGKFNRGSELNKGKSDFNSYLTLEPSVMGVPISLMVAHCWKT